MKCRHLVLACNISMKINEILRFDESEESSCQCGRHSRPGFDLQSLGWEDPLEEEMAPHCSILAGIIPWTEEPGGPIVHAVTKESDTTE